MRIHDLLSELNQTNVKSIQQNKSLLEAAQTLNEFNIGALAVVDRDNKIEGIISERDIVRSVVNNGQNFFEKEVKDEMTSSVITCSSDDITDDIYQLIGKKKIRHIPVVKDNKLLAMLSIRDFEKAHEIIRGQSLTDELTGLHNLPHIENTLDSWFNQYRRFQTQFSILTITIDHYKLIEAANDYAANDSLLKKLADTFRNSTRSFDVVGRTADARFIVAFRNADRNTAIRACERLRLTVESEFTNPAPGIEKLTISTGLAVSNHDDRNGMEVMERSVNLARTAAGSGGNCMEVDIEKLYKIAV